MKRYTEADLADAEAYYRGLTSEQAVAAAPDCALGLIAEVRRLREGLGKLHREAKGYQHGESCVLCGHDECCEDEDEQGGWYCEQGETREECQRGGLRVWA